MFEDVVATTGEVGRDLLGVDWSSTPLGPPQKWPSSLQTIVRVVLTSRFSMWMAWGPELTFFCNDAYRQDTLGQKYPWALGRPAPEVWAEIWPDIGPRIESVLKTGAATWDERLLLFLERSGYLEETYHTFSYSPLADDDGLVAGMLCVVSEETDRVISERRLRTLRGLGAALSAAQGESDVLAAAQTELSENRRSLPFTALYIFSDDARTADLAFTTGGAPGDPVAPQVVAAGDPAACWPVDELASGSSVLVDDLNARFSRLPASPLGKEATHALVVPLAQYGQPRPLGFLVAGLNPYLAVDADLYTFVGLMAAQLASSLASGRAYDAERRRAEQLTELDRAKTAFFTGVSHELRTPLTLLLAPAQDALADDQHPLEPAQRARLELILRNAQRLSGLVDTVLDFSRLEAGRMTRSTEAIDLAAETHALASMFRSACERAGLALTIDISALSAPVAIDREMWAKIMLNLLSNAVKYTFEGSVVVRLRCDESGERVELSVTDTGVGIPEADLPRVFERFHRVEGLSARSHEGSGIGLSLVDELVRLHGGEVSVQSAEGKGSTFSVSLPFDEAAEPTDAAPGGAGTRGTPNLAEPFLVEVQRWLEAVADEDREAALPGGRRPRILVADDNLDMRAYVSGLLRGDYLVDVAPDGEVARELARTNPPDLVIADVMMPNLDGFGLLKSLRADPQTVGIPVILVSARAGEEGVAEGLEAGADDYLVKPFSARELRARVRANLELDRVRRAQQELRRSQNLLDEAERIGHLGSFEIDLDTGMVMAASDGFLRMLGLDTSDVGVIEISDALARVIPEDRGEVMTNIARSTQPGDSLEHELRVRVNNEWRWICIRAEVVAEPDGSKRLRGSAQDITDQHRIADERAAATAAREALAREHQIAEELQRSLLPPVNAEALGLEVAAYYQAGVRNTQVGGDWYDVIAKDDGRTVLVVGDVMGRGVHAATVMGQVRTAVRAYSLLDVGPSELMQLVDALVCDLAPDELVTCVCAIYDPTEHSLRYANAGHVPPLVVQRGAPPIRLLGSGPPLGNGELDCSDGLVIVPEAATIALYTDGLVERRGDDIEQSIDVLAERLLEQTTPLSDLPPRLIQAQFGDHAPDDDIAVLLARRA